MAVTSWMHGLPHSLSVAEEGTAGEEEEEKKKWMMMARSAERRGEVRWGHHGTGRTMDTEEFGSGHESGGSH